MTEQMKIDWLTIKLVSCIGPTQNHKHTLGHIPHSHVCIIFAPSIFNRYGTTTDELDS